MIRLLLSDVRQLEDPEVFARVYDNASSERRAAADKFRFAKDRNLSIGAAALLDYGLSAFGLREKDMTYGRNAYGKPFFLNAPEIHFNISHSGSKVAVALSDREVGCDIEQIADIEMEVGERFFCRDEYEEMMSETDFEARRKAFFRFWTLKKSYMKAAGLGMSLPPASFSVKGGIPGFAFITPPSFDGYATALCYNPECGIPEVCEQ